MKNKNMKSTMKHLALSLGVVAISTVAFGQKKNVTNAAVEYGNNKMFPMSMASPDFDAAKTIESIKRAKEFIDLAAAHEETKNDQKQYRYQGLIYSAVAALSVFDSTAFDIEPDAALEKSLTAFSNGLNAGKRYTQDIVDDTKKWAYLFEMAGGQLYQTEKFAEAGESYMYAAKYKKAGGTVDTITYYNAAISFERVEKNLEAAQNFEEIIEYKTNSATIASYASRNYRLAGDMDKAIEVVSKARENDPNNKDLLIELVNINLDKGDSEGAEKALTDAVAADPNNASLHYAIGTVYMDLNENEKAEASLNKALEIKPDYEDAQYQLGALLVGWGGDLKLEASNLKFGDPNYNKLLAESEAIYNRAVAPLEKYIDKNPNDKVVLDILFKLHKNLGNNEKALEYKKRAAEAQ